MLYYVHMIRFESSRFDIDRNTTNDSSLENSGESRQYTQIESSTPSLEGLSAFDVLDTQYEIRNEIESLESQLQLLQRAGDRSKVQAIQDRLDTCYEELAQNENTLGELSKRDPGLFRRFMDGQYN